MGEADDNKHTFQDNFLAVSDLVCRYHESSPKNPADENIVDQLSFNLNKNEIGCLLGSSGCGKTTLLRAIAGFQPAISGSIYLDGVLLSGGKTHAPPEERKIGMVFQDYALFPHLNVIENIIFGLGKLDKYSRQQKSEELVALVKLEGFEKRLPHELSGGQQQRVALARALAPAPKLLLLDEPFSSLDTDLRRSLALEVRSILKAKNISAIMVTHDQEEAFAFADKIGVIHRGKLEHWDVPFNLYHQPQSRFVANFIGQGVFIPGFLRASNSIETELGVLQSKHDFSWKNNSAVEVLIRPDDIVEDKNSQFHGEVINKIFAGTSTLYTLQLETGSKIEAALASHDDFDIGEKINFKVEADHIIAFPLNEESK